MKFSYEGYDLRGTQVRGLTDAASVQEATEALHRQGVLVSELRLVLSDAGKSGTGVARGLSVQSSSRLERVAAMVRQLALLTSTGTPVVDALASMERQAVHAEWKSTIGSLRKQVEEGKSLSEAMGTFPRYFDAVARSLVSAGETGGRMDTMLERLARLTRQQVKVRKTLQGALVYPALLIAIATSVLITMIVFVLPRFEGLFKTLNTPLPTMTKWLMAGSNFLRSDWYFVLGGIALLLGGVVWYLRGPSGKRTVDMLMIRLPQVGGVTRAFATARLARLLGVLLDGRVPMLDALALVRESMGNTFYRDAVARAEEAVIRGENLSSALEASGLVSAAVVEGVKSGEKSGQLAPVLVAIAEHMDEDNEVAIKTLLGLLEPCILVVLGVIVGTVAISMMLPLFDLASAAGGGGA